MHESCPWRCGVWVTVLTALGLASGCTKLPNDPAGPFAPPLRGVTMVDWTADGYASAAASTSLVALRATGANTVIVLVTGYQSDAQAARVHTEDPRTPTPAAVEQLVGAARALGLKVALKPHVDLDDGSWRGHLAPRDEGAWFDSYRAFLLPWASLAQSLGVEQFVVGTELAGTLENESEWRRTIAAVRAVFEGELLYAASWDEASKVPFWNSLDLVGVDFYFPITVRPNAGRLEMLAGWQQCLDRLDHLHRQTGRDLVLTEIGYRSIDGAGMAPYAFRSRATLDPGEQADLYWAALQATGSVRWLRGLYWWNWPADGTGGPGNADYTPAGKPAAQELAAAWAGM